ncbi:MAG: glyoxalase [Deltaproteobacteria bacterium]|nr:glyoxalase [Deltaproteobacteria bacterium]
MKLQTILYVRDQGASTRFYGHVLAREPTLEVPGMTELEVGDSVLGLMPESSIERLLGEALPSPAAGAGIPRAELYFLVDEPAAYHARALVAGARELSPLSLRDWGHEAAYSLDLDGHVLAFARPASSSSRAPDSGAFERS